MKQYLDLMKDILENGIDLPDRTGSGRRKVFGRMLRFDLSTGEFPLVTTCQTPFKNVIKETLWFIEGSTDNAELLKQGVKIWDLWAVKDKHVEAFLAKYFPEADEEARQYLMNSYRENGIEQIGNMYGRAWRDVAATIYNQLFPEITKEDVAPDRYAAIEQAYQEQAPKFEDGTPVPFDVFFKATHYSSIDQLQELLVGLKKRPFSSRHIISAWIPEFIPFEGLSPQENVLLGKGALAPCHVLQQYLVFPPKVPGGKNRISLMMTQR